MQGGRLTLTDDNNNVYEFPRSLWIDSGGVQNNISTQNTFYAAGGKNIADGFLQARTITITGSLRGDDPILYENQKREFFQACYRGGKLQIDNDVIPRYIEIKDPSFENEQEQGQLYLPITVTFLAEFPFWQDSTEIEHIETITGNTSFTVSNLSNSDFIIRPRFQFVATDSGGLPGVKLTNNSDGGASFEYNNDSFLIGDVLTIDSSLGTVKLNNGNSIDKFRPANFLRLQPGDNIFEYEGSGCTLTVFYRKVYTL